MFHQIACVGYEKNILDQYHENKTSINVFSNPENNLDERIEKVREGAERESIEYICEWIASEKTEVEVFIMAYNCVINCVQAFLEAISQRDKYEALKNKMQEKQTNLVMKLQSVSSGKNDLQLILLLKSKKEEIASLEKQISEVSFFIES